MTVIGFEWNQEDDVVRQMLHMPVDKSFILSSDGYKKYDEEVRRNMTPAISNKEELGIIEVTASGEYPSTHGSYAPWKAFSKNIDGYSRWLVASDRPSGGHWLKVNFKNGFALSDVSMVTQVTTSGDVGVKNWEIFGSNDNINFDKLGSYLAKNEHLVEQLFKINNHNTYSIYRFNFLDNYYGNSTTTVRDMKIIGVSEGETSRWKKVSLTLPTLPQFQSEGMEDLSSLDRKVQPVLESPQQMASSVLGEGKVFKGTVDLKKYFDLRQVEVK